MLKTKQLASQKLKANPKTIVNITSAYTYTMDNNYHQQIQFQSIVKVTSEIHNTRVNKKDLCSKLNLKLCCIIIYKHA